MELKPGDRVVVRRIVDDPGILAPQRCLTPRRAGAQGVVSMPVHLDFNHPVPGQYYVRQDGDYVAYLDQELLPLPPP